jgi:GNAT superfamily N-acetyltransferase
MKAGPATTIRPATESDVAALIDAYDWLFQPPGYTPHGWDPERAAEALREAIADDRSTVLLAEDDGELIGICSAYLDLHSVRFGRRCWVEDLAVHPDRRSQGIGGQLLAEVREWARASGATHFELDTGMARTEAQRFYERQGEARRGISYSWPL